MRGHEHGSSRRSSAAPAPAAPAPQRAEVRKALGAPRLQAKLTVGQPGDEYEREADRVAEEVTRGHATGISAASPPAVQRACSCGGTCDKCREKDEELRRSPEAGAPTPSEAPASVHQTLSSPGRPLERGIRERLEPRFGVDFGGVRIHTDSQSARDVSARAYTVGNDVVFAPGEYSPGTESGDRLIAHELTHVVQQVRHLARKEKLTCGSGYSDGYGSLGPWVANQPRPPGIRDKAYYITGTWREGDDKDSFFQRTVDSWIRWRFGSVSGTVRAQIHKILPPENNKWFAGITVEDHRPGCQYRVYIAPSSHDAISLLVKRDRAAIEAEMREAEAGLGGAGGPGNDVTGGSEVPEGARAAKPGEKGFRPSGSEYMPDGGLYGASATAPAFPARILGPDFQADEGIGYYTMSLNTSIAGNRLEQLIEGFNYIDYHWERYDITSLVEKGMRAETEKAFRRSVTDSSAEVGSFEGTEGRAKHSVKKLGRDARNAAHDLLNPAETAYTGTATEVLENLYANKLNLELLPASAIVSMGGTALGALADLIGGKAQEREMTWPKEGYYLIRCIARPNAQKTRTRAASVAVKVVEVRKPEKLAKTGLDEPDAAVAQAEFELELAKTPEEKARKSAALEQHRVNASGSALQVLQQRRANLEEERKRATGRTAERLKDQVEKLDEQILRLQNELAEADGEVLRPRLSLASEVTGQTYPLLVSLVPLKRKENGPYRYRLVDVTGKGSENFEGAGMTQSKAAWNAVRQFSVKNGYGEGQLAVRFLNAGDTQISPAQEVIPNVKRGFAQTRERLADLATALVALGLLVPGVGEVAAVLGAVIAADRLYHRWSTGTLEPDGEAIADVLGVIGALGMGASALGKLKVVRGEKAFALALQEADDVAIKAALKTIEQGSSVLEKINKANELLGHAGMLVGNVELFKQFIAIQQQELDGTLNHAEARRMRFSMLLGALRDNAVPLHLIRGEKPAKASPGQEAPPRPAGTPHEGAPAPREGTPVPHEAAPTPHGELEPGGRTTDPSPLKPGDEGTVKLGEGLTGRETIVAHTTTRDKLHNVVILEDGRIIRCSRSCGDILSHYDSFLKEETDAGRKEKADAFKTKLEALEADSKATKDPAERERIAEEAAAIDQELRTFAAERLAGELKIGTAGAEGLLSMLRPKEVRALRAELGEKLFNYLASRSNPNVVRKFVEALDTAQTAEDRALVIHALELGPKVGEKQLLQDLNYLTDRPDPAKPGDLVSLEHAESAARTEVAEAKEAKAEKQRKKRRTREEIAADNAEKERKRNERAEQKKLRQTEEERKAAEKKARDEAKKKAEEERAAREAAQALAEAENKVVLEAKKSALQAERARLQAELADIYARTNESQKAIRAETETIARLVAEADALKGPENQKARDALHEQAKAARDRRTALVEAEQQIPSPGPVKDKIPPIEAELARVEAALNPQDSRAGLPCFAAGTPVWTPSGPRPIEQIREGDAVLAWDLHSGAVVERRVSGVLRNRTLHFYDIAFRDGSEVRATGLHRFWVEDRQDWIDARHLTPGMRCLRPGGGTVEVASAVRREGFEEETWNLTVEELSSYFVGTGVLVHNEGGGIDLKLGGNLLIYRGTNPKYPGFVYIGQSDSIDREGEHRQKARDQLRKGGLSARDLEFYTFMSEVELVVLVSGINKPQADFLEQKNIEYERDQRPNKEKQVLNRREQIKSKKHFEKVVKAILEDPAVKAAGFCPG